MDVSSLKYVVPPRTHYYAARTQRDASSYCPFIRYFINSTPIAHRLSVLAFPNSPPTTVPMDGGLKPSPKLARYLIDVNGASEKMHGIWANASSRRLRIMYRLFACHTHTHRHIHTFAHLHANSDLQKGELRMLVRCALKRKISAGVQFTLKLRTISSCVKCCFLG